MAEVTGDTAPVAGEDGKAAGAEASAPPKVWTPATIYSLVFLAVIALFNYGDRNLFGLVMLLVKQEMALSDTVLGLMSGFAFVAFYALLGVPLAWLADRSSRRNIIGVCFGFWRLITVLTGFVATVGQLALLRFVGGGGAAGGHAPSKSMVSDLFGRRWRTLAVAVLTSMSALDGLISYPILGWVAQTFGWRTAYFWAGAPGVVLAVFFLLTVKEPKRGAIDKETNTQQVSIWRTLKFLCGARTFLLVAAGSAFIDGAGASSSAWNPTFLIRVHDYSIAQAGAVIGPVRAVAGVLGIVCVGWLTEILCRKEERWRLWLPVIACLMVIPGRLVFLLGETVQFWIVGMFLQSMFAFAYQAPAYTAVMNVAQSRMRAVSISLVMFTANVFGHALGPLIVGMLSDYLHPTRGDEAIRYALLSLTGFAVVAAGLFYLASRSYAQDLARAERE